MSKNHIGTSDIHDTEFLVIAKALKQFYTKEITEEDFISIIDETSVAYVETVTSSSALIESNDPDNVKGFIVSYKGEEYAIYVNKQIIQALADSGDVEEIEKLKKLENYEKSKITSKTLYNQMLRFSSTPSPNPTSYRMRQSHNTRKKGPRH